MHEKLCFARQNVSRSRCGGKLVGRTGARRSRHVRIMVGSVLEWNCQFRRRFVHVFAHSSIVLTAQSLQELTAQASFWPVSFAAGHRKSYWNGCFKVAIAICHDIFSILALVIFF